MSRKLPLNEKSGKALFQGVIGVKSPIRMYFNAAYIEQNFNLMRRTSIGELRYRKIDIWHTTKLLQIRLSSIELRNADERYQTSFCSTLGSPQCVIA